MRYVYENRDAAREVGLRAHREITENWTWEKAAEKAIRSIRKIEQNQKTPPAYCIGKLKRNHQLPKFSLMKGRREDE
jgi:hypothetical protein